MPRFITVTVGCDWPAGCDTQGVEGDGTVGDITLAIDNKQAKRSLLCKQHREQLDEILLPLMAVGIKVDSPGGRNKKPSTGASPSDPDVSAEGHHCMEEGCGQVPKNRAGLAQHVIRTHGYESLAAYEAVHHIHLI